MSGHAQYTLGLVTCIDNVVDNACVGYHQMASYFLKLTMEIQSGKRKAENGLPTYSRQQNFVHLFRDSYSVKWPYIVPSECDDYAFCKVCDDSFFVEHGGGNDVIVTVSLGHIAELNKL